MRGIAAGGVYLACKMLHIPISQQRIAQEAGISDITLRSRFKEIYWVYQKSPGVLLKLIEERLRKASKNKKMTIHSDHTDGHSLVVIGLYLGYFCQGIEFGHKSLGFLIPLG